MIYNNSIIHNLFFANITLINNIAYIAGTSPVCVYPPFLYIHGNNTWDSSPSVTVFDEDFVLLPTSASDCLAILSAPRKADGSLPDIGGYFHLALGSDLIDAGINVGLPYSGSAPDIGAFEYS